jgi:hypothetical protein
VKSRRWMRFALPFVVVAGLATLTGIVHAVEQSDPTDASFLSPTSDEGEGARRLADSLARDGVDIDVRSSTADVLTAAGAGGPATVFVTTPGLVNPSYLDQFQSLPPEVRVVLVAPGAEQVRRAGLTIPVGGPRWTAAAPQPGCSTDYATAAGPAAALRLAYDPGGYRAVRCYQDGLVEIQTPRARMTLIGASDPFRNDRADEHGNHTLAVGLLGRAPRVIWLDLHERESDPAPTATPPPPAPTRDDQSGTDESEPREGEEDEAGEPTDGPSGQPGTARRRRTAAATRSPEAPWPRPSRRPSGPPWRCSPWPPWPWPPRRPGAWARRSPSRCPCGSGPPRRYAAWAACTGGPAHAAPRWPPCRTPPACGSPSISGCRRTHRWTRWPSGWPP